ncbi:unnamed protein product, partial [Rotaria magnacalcarata]
EATSTTASINKIQSPITDEQEVSPQLTHDDSAVCSKLVVVSTQHENLARMNETKQVPVENILSIAPRVPSPNNQDSSIATESELVSGDKRERENI